MNRFILIFISLLLFTGCGEGDPDVSDNEDTTKTVEKGKPGISPKVIEDLLQTIPQPTELSFMIKDMGVKYDRALLNSPENAGKYNDEFKRALNLGIYSTDLGFANIFEQSQDAIDFLIQVKDMADGLEVGKYFDFEKIKELTASSGNLDELMQITTENLQKMNEQLQQADRSDVTVLIVTGGWVESFYLTMNVLKKQRNQQMEEIVAGQKIALDKLIELVGFYETSSKMKTLKTNLNELENMLKNIKMEVKKGESKAVEKDGQLIVESTDEVKVEMTKENIDEIHAKINAIRDNIIS